MKAIKQDSVGWIDGDGYGRGYKSSARRPPLSRRAPLLLHSRHGYPFGQGRFLFESSSMLRSFFSTAALARKPVTLSFFGASSVPASELQSLPNVLLGLIHDVALSQEPVFEFASIHPRPNDVRLTLHSKPQRGLGI